MPIINLGSADDRAKPGFQTHLHTQDFRASSPPGVPYVQYEDRAVEFGPHVYYTYLSHIGLCIRDFERNGYDDSDFCMVVWDPVKHEPDTICFASTRGWSYPCYGSSADATPEVLAEFKACEDALEFIRIRNQFAKRACQLWEFRASAKTAAQIAGVPVGRITKLRKTIGEDKTARIIALFGSRIRSPFKLKLRDQVVAWLKQPAPQYPTPLSKRQMEFI